MDLPRILFQNQVSRALQEDLGRGGDLTSDSVVFAETQGQGRIVARESGCLAGVAVAVETFRQIDEKLRFPESRSDGETVEEGDLILEIQGAARSILTAERTALNFLAHLSGIATATRNIALRIRDFPTRVTCTRKTTPGLRALEKYAVRAGGGSNHRLGLDDAILIKDNHLAIAGGAAEAVRRARLRAGHLVKIEVEVDTAEQFREVIGLPIDVVLLDNMSPEEVRRLASHCPEHMQLEISGNIDLESAVQYARAGADYISVGRLTHSSPALDLSLELEPL